MPIVEPGGAARATETFTQPPYELTGGQTNGGAVSGITDAARQCRKIPGAAI
jgi:hypothetical protein